MDHEVFVPVPAETVRQLLRDPARVARCVHGLQQEATDSTAEPEAPGGSLSGRLKVRVANHSITYRGTLRITERDGGFVLTGEGVEVRGAGSAQTELTVGVTDTEGGTALHFSGCVQADGRLSELSDEAALHAAHRLLDRFAERLVAEVADEQSAAGTAPEVSTPSEQAAGVEGPGPVSREDAERLGIVGDEPEEPTEPNADTTKAAPSAPQAGAEAEFVDLEGLALEGIEDFGPIPEEPPAEAAHARRTMIGRSAEEVDHAPPRGRYAPVPAPDGSNAGVPLRWVAPAAALALASAVVVSRALRRRR
ncbi:SRPBCC family protein [Streptomyces albipurpureus]|uniref:SRPBCC domain-containing protein n=1 Tax=Streptomyces albipurpureus TaxID=2897419 RepID=A0ABT0UT85_9ACTN|nr:SRPBCC domain-containing protein [Streptomyces sp. CWNU-1]MCM2391295.1 SRPBCC domain-containing protein [Streptomyces sp. CWNU-1]